jgi:phosphoglycolate phosphatase
VIDHVIFDLDGTLVDSVFVCVEIVNEMLSERERDPTVRVEQARPLMSIGGAAMIRALLGSHCGDPNVEIASFRDRYATRPTPTHRLFAGVRDGLDRLRRDGVTLSICSNKPQNLCEKTLSDLAIDTHFATVVGTLPGRRSKPAPDLVDTVLANVGATPDRCIFIGDSELDHQVALTRGIPFVLLSHGYADPNWRAGDILRCDTFVETVDLILALRATPPVRRAAAG